MINFQNGTYNYLEDIKSTCGKIKKEVALLNVESLLLDFKRIALELEKKFPSVSVAGHVGLIWAVNKLDLKPPEKPKQRGYDAVDQTGKKYEIKTRRTAKKKMEAGRKVRVVIISKNQMKTLDYLVLVQLNPEYEVEAACVVPKDVLLKYSKEMENKELTGKYLELYCFPLKEKKLYTYPGVNRVE